MNTLTLGVFAGLVFAGAAVHGAVTQRWAAFAPDPARTTRAHDAVITFADWEGAEIPNDLPVKERSTATSRRYTSAGTGHVVATSIITGIPGAVSTHTPDVCYAGSGYRCLRGPLKETLELPGGGTATCFVADFERKRETTVERQRVRWAWSAGGRWDAPDAARFAYLREPLLFKLYVVTQPPDDGSAADPAPVAAFVSAAFAKYAAAVARP